MPKSTRTIRKIANTFITVASGETYKVSDLICHVAKVKVARSALSMADVIHFFKVFNIPFEANALIKPKKYLFNTLRNIFHVSTFQQLFPNTAIFSTVFISRNHVQLARSLLRIQRFDKTKRK